MKKFIALTLAVFLVFSLCACGVNTSFTSTNSVTENGVTTTTTTTTENGKTETTTTQSVAYPEGSCGAAAQDGEKHKVPVTIQNTTGDKITGIYGVPTGQKEWSNVLQEGQVLEDGETLSDYITLTYDKNDLSYDIGIKNGAGEMTEFGSLSIDTLSADGFTIIFRTDEAGEPHMTIPKEFVK